MIDNRDHIAEYVCRIRNDDPMAERPITKYHRVESRVLDGFWCHCGRLIQAQIASEPKSHLIFAVAAPEGQRCLRD